jgi:AcrR family transcriptional regulator
MTTEIDSPRKQPKGDKRDRTRAKLLEAARSLIREKGHEHATLDAIAERAGMTTGAIYGNFKNRDELFLALGQTYWAPIKPNVRPGATFPEIMRALADATLAVIPDRSAAAVGRLTGMAYTLTHQELRAKVAEFTACHERRRSPHARRPACARHARLKRRPRLPKAAHAGTDARRGLPCGLRRAGEEGKRLTR